MARGLGQLPHCEADIAAYERAVADFTDPTNLALLCHLVANQNKQRAIAALILRRSGRESPRDMEVQSLLGQIYKAVRDQNGGRNFRVIY